MKEITIYCYNRCTTCKKAEKYLEEKATKNKNIVIIKKDRLYTFNGGIE